MNIYGNIWRKWLRPAFISVLTVTALVLIGHGISAFGQTSDSGTVTVQARAVTTHINAYAQVEPMNTLPVNAAQAGVLSGLRVLPGMQVRAGEALAHLNGPGIQAALSQSQADVQSAETQRNAAQKSLAIQRRQLLLHLSTREMVHQAESAEAQAQATLDNARAHLKAVRQMMTVTAPANATVLTLNAADGELVSAGQPIVTLQAANRLWLKAAYYGANISMMHVGMTGAFSPADGGEAIHVRVCAVFGAIATGGGESVALLPLSAKADLLNGESGVVALNLPQRTLVVVPTRALILSQGKWWVMVHTEQGNHPEQVTLGPVEGWNTFIESGLAPGTQVVVNNAYLLFHASIAEHYQIPD